MNMYKKAPSKNSSSLCPAAIPGPYLQPLYGRLEFAMKEMFPALFFTPTLTTWTVWSGLAKKLGAEMSSGTRTHPEKERQKAAQQEYF